MSITYEQFHVEMPDDILIPQPECNVLAISEAIYGDLAEKFNNADYFRDMAILAPTLDDVQEVNDFLIDQISGDVRSIDISLLHLIAGKNYCSKLIYIYLYYIRA